MAKVHWGSRSTLVRPYKRVPFVGIIDMSLITYWLKFVLFFLLNLLRRRLSSTATTGGGRRKVYSMVQKEMVRDLSKDGLTIDASYFNGFDLEGRFLGLGMQRRLDGRCESVFFLRLPEVTEEPLVLPASPLTWTRTCSDDEWRTEAGLFFDMREPMRRWKVGFEGEVVTAVSRRSFKVRFEFEWTRRSLTFDTDTDMDGLLMARTIAAQPWSKRFFHDLQELHQTHYEVFGELVGSLKVGDLAPRELTLTSMKDRSYGKHRNWGDFRRYILHYLATEDGLYIGCHFVSITKTFRHLLVGFVMDGNGKKVAFRSCSKTLADIGEDSLPFQEPYSFECVDVDGSRYEVQVQVGERVKFFCGEDRDGTLFSAYVNGTVNGVRMTGMCEYEYNSRRYSDLLEA